MLVRWDRLGCELAADPIRLLGKYDRPAEAQGRQGTRNTPETRADDQYVCSGLQGPLAFSPSVPAGRYSGEYLGEAKPGDAHRFEGRLPDYHRS